MYRSIVLCCAGVLAACGDGAQPRVPTLQDVALTTPEDTPLSITVPLTAVELDAVTLTVETPPSHGTLSGDGPTWTYTPAANYFGNDSVAVTAADAYGSASATVSITVTSVNDAPIAVGDTAMTDEDTVLTLADATLLANDSDPEHQAITITAVGSATHGTVSHAGTTVTFTPVANYHGAATFAYTGTDGDMTYVATVAVTVNSVNDVPVANNDTATTNEDTVLNLTASSLVANDTDVDGDARTITVVTATDDTHGTVALDAGLVIYTPAANYDGPASFTYTVSDGNGGTATATVAVTVDPVNDAPIAVADAFSTNENAMLMLAAIQITSNDTDADDDGLTLTAVSETATTHGTVSLASGTVTYTPALNYAGAADFDYTVSDGNGGTATGHVVITVTAIGAPPNAADSSAVSNEVRVDSAR
jgi:VCBS repeat-containing protein